MNPLQVRMIIETLGISVMMTSILYVIPSQVYIDGEPRLMTVFITLFLIYQTYNHNHLFHELINKWFGDK